MTKSEKTVLIGSVIFDPETGVLADEEGSETALRPQTAQVLALLATNPGQLVTKEALMDAVWAETHVTDDSLVQCISEIRKVLGSESGQHLKTIPKHGYKLEAINTTKTETTHPRPKAKFIWASVIAICLAFVVAFLSVFPAPDQKPLDEPPVIAVLPFRNVGSETYNYFSDGLTEDLISALTKVSGLRAIAPTSVFDYREELANVSGVAAELGADYVVQGSIRRSNDGIRISAYMLDSVSGQRVWTDQFDRSASDVLDLQDDLVQRIVTALSVELEANERAELLASKAIDPIAYDLLLKGLEHYRKFSLEENEIAREYFRRATVIDPEFSRAQADLAMTYVWELQLGTPDDPSKVAQQGLVLARHALAMDSDNPFASFAVSVLSRTLGDHTTAIETAYRTTEANPGYADGHGLLALTLNFAGQPENGLKAIKTAMSLNPRVPFFYNFIEGQSHYLLGNFETAATNLEIARDQNPEYIPTRKLLAATYVALDRLDDAEWEVAEIEVRQPGISISQERLGAPYRQNEVFAEYIRRIEVAGIEFVR